MGSRKVEKSRIRGKTGSRFCRHRPGDPGSSLLSSGLNFPTCRVRKKIRHYLCTMQGLPALGGEQRRGQGPLELSYLASSLCRLVPQLALETKESWQQKPRESWSQRGPENLGWAGLDWAGGEVLPCLLCSDRALGWGSWGAQMFSAHGLEPSGV